MANLERIEADFQRMGAHPGASDRFMPYLEALNNKDEETLRHSVRVAHLGKKIADFTHLVPQKTLWLPGLVHDVGKLLIHPETLTKKVGFDEKDMEQMRNHVEYGCKMLLGVADFSAFALFYHHFFKTKGAYPSQEDFNRIFGKRFDSWTEGSRTLAKYCGRLIAVADFYDAATTRKNDKFSPGNPRLPTSDESKRMLIEENADQIHLIQGLYEAGIF
jgi:hypothetical protein